MTRAEKQKWESVRAQGRGRFILRAGLLRCGLPFGLFVTIGTLAIRFFANWPKESPRETILKFAFYVLGYGGFCGAVAWTRQERDFQKETDGDTSAISASADTDK